MRVVRSEEGLPKSFREARNEALTAFGDDTVFIEKYIENPKHIEVQILGDNFGNIVHLYERDCSVQRRFQKVVEVAPSTLPQEIKDKLYEYALRITRHVNYNNAGTVEFLVDQDHNIFFIEVNPRIQVEHTITEEVTGIDIVRSQILIAAGAPSLPPADFLSNLKRIYIVMVLQFNAESLPRIRPMILNQTTDASSLIAMQVALGFVWMREILMPGSAFPLSLTPCWSK